ncbi:N-acyl homoserine lactonase family protein [Xanthobacter dioxanivorans]|uniref:N-acyl homoserine lactonase family protein n=1 Tax=Xanthobacter dioxanivorans TaxID=2528964 RepID=A0A974SGX3_9HYPH|nr:N-acyl homoserine lactonase family protein [Xanthobacter dioxanivorans]QRG04792.1 N-acyl homoserine lactonase family protein [Xanthobacter dioxanivorans]
MKMHVLNGGRLRMKKHVYQPDADRAETIELPVSSFLLRHAQGNVLFDTGCNPAVVTDAEGRWGGVARAMTPIMGPDDNVVSQLACVGLAPDDIDVVICSHFHPDHCGCNGFFRKATVVVHALELAAAKAENAQAAGYLAVDWDQGNPLELIEGEKDLFGDGRVTLIPLPGHTPGLTGALVTLDRDGPFLLASDAVSLRSSLDAGVVPKNTWNVEQHVKTIVEIRRIEAAGATVLCGHDDAQYAGLRKGADAYE